MRSTSADVPKMKGRDFSRAMELSSSEIDLLLTGNRGSKNRRRLALYQEAKRKKGYQLEFDSLSLTFFFTIRIQ